MGKKMRTFVLTAAFIFCAALTTNSQTTPDKTFYGVTTAGELISFKGSKPNKLMKVPKISGMQTGERLVGIDFRPSNKMLYGVTNQNRIYSINTATGAATAAGTLTTALTGATFGVDFNPVPDRLRITTDTDQNLRANPADATNVVDKPLTFNTADANKGANPNVAASAYTNNVAGTKTTTLYNIDSALDVLLTQIPPNDGVLNTVGKLGVNVTANAGFDVISSGDNNTAFAALQVEGEKTSKLYSINLTTGAATLIGKIAGKNPLVGLAVVLD
jgi:hypothetical protein